MPIVNQEDGSFVSEVAALVRQTPELEKIGRGQYAHMVGDKLELIGTPLLAEPKTIQTSTLSAIVDAAKNPLPFGQAENVVVQVVSPNEVRLLTPSVGEERQQFEYVRSTVDKSALRIGQYLPAEDFVLMILSQTASSSERLRLLQYVSKLSAGILTDIEDDGATQSTTVKSGVTRSGEAAWQNPVLLQPFRTFAEVEQPESNFVMRLRQVADGDKKTAQVGLFEADGAAWKVEAIKNIGDYLRAHLPEGVTVLA